MSLVPVRDLRNHTADVVRRVQNGEDITITANGAPLATLVPPRIVRKSSLSRAELAAILRTPADRGLLDDLAELAGDTTEDLGPIR